MSDQDYTRTSARKWQVLPRQQLLVHRIATDGSLAPKIAIELSYLLVSQLVIDVDGNVATPTLVAMLDVYSGVVNSFDIIQSKPRAYGHVLTGIQFKVRCLICY